MVRFAGHFGFNPGQSGHLMPHRLSVLARQQRPTVVTLGRLEIDHVLHLFDRHQLPTRPGVSKLPVCTQKLSGQSGSAAVVLRAAGISSAIADKL
jgi:hypothetical protein